MPETKVGIFKFLTALFYLIITSVSHSIEPPDINNIIINKDNKSYENVIFKDVNNQDVNLDDFKNKWLVGLDKDGLLVGVNWSGKRATGYDVEPLQVLQNIEFQLSK